MEEIDDPSELIDFYKDRGNARGAGTFHQMVECWDDQMWELNHDFIQWLFPLVNPSMFNPDAPCVTAAEVKYFRLYEPMKAKMFRAFLRFLRFVGLQCIRVDEGEYSEPYERFGVLVEKADFFDKKEAIWRHPNHNWLRITRVIASMHLMGMEAEAQALFLCICALYNEGCGSEESFSYWQKAAEGKIV